MQERYKTFTVLIAKINRNIKRLKSDVMSAFDLKCPHVSCLYYLYADGPLTAKQLCEICDEDKGALSRSLERLEEEGLIENVKTGRKYKSPFKLTKKGEQIGAHLVKKIDEVVSLASQGITDEERTMLFSGLNSVSENLQKIVIQREEKV